MNTISSSKHSQVLVHAHGPWLQVRASGHPLADTLQVGMSTTGYPGGKQVETLIDTANAILGSQRSLDADTESGF